VTVVFVFLLLKYLNGCLLHVLVPVITDRILDAQVYDAGLKNNWFRIKPTIYGVKE